VCSKNSSPRRHGDTERTNEFSVRFAATVLSGLRDDAATSVTQPACLRSFSPCLCACVVNPSPMRLILGIGGGSARFHLSVRRFFFSREVAKVQRKIAAKGCQAFSVASATSVSSKSNEDAAIRITQPACLLSFSPCLCVSVVNPLLCA
jgi:hypothetical protein